jgi:hypothetical protein
VGDGRNDGQGERKCAQKNGRLHIMSLDGWGGAGATGALHFRQLTPFERDYLPAIVGTNV